MVSLLAILVTALLLTVLFILLSADFRRSFFHPATFGERWLVKSLGPVAIATLIADFAVGHSSNGLRGISPCVCFGMYCSLVLYVRAVYFLRKRELPDEAAQVQ